MREIGGYFGLEKLIHKEYYSGLIALNTARNALLYIMRARNIKKIYIPFYLCDSVSKMLDREGLNYEYYHVKKNFMPDFSKKLNEREYLYIVNYYGIINNSKVHELSSLYGNKIILDNVQAFFQAPINGIDTIYSCRKFFGVPDGAYLSSNVILDCELDTDKSSERMTHILGRCEGRRASDYYADFKKSDESYINLPLMKMSWLTSNLLGAVDYDRVKNIREENYNVLASLLGDNNILSKFSPSLPAGPYAYPYYCEGGMTVKKKLAERKIYVATLWPYALTCGDVTAEDYAANILPVPCDQRYNSDDMKYIAKELKKIVQTERA